MRCGSVLSTFLLRVALTFFSSADALELLYVFNNACSSHSKSFRLSGAVGSAPRFYSGVAVPTKVGYGRPET